MLEKEFAYSKAHKRKVIGKSHRQHWMVEEEGPKCFDPEMKADCVLEDQRF